MDLDTPVIALERLRFVDDEPWVYTTSHVPFALAPDLLTHDLTRLSLYHLLQEVYGLQIERSDRVVEAQVDIGRVYRLQAVTGGGAEARSLCNRLKDDGLACFVK